ncbi:hypothetical protein AX15_002444 [Amanita polypyramis BW_CC]|nr:hypothetical protein AX15_002444 [Amanita polypyramis BW_CC]
MSAPTSLCPGYKHVEQFGPDEEYESGEEVSYVTFDLGNVEPTLVPSSSTYRLIGLDTPDPYLQLSGTVLKGRHDSLLGTEMLFTDEKDTQDRDKRSVVHVANTEQRVLFKEVRLQPKETVVEGSSHEAAATSAAHAESAEQPPPGRSKHASAKDKKPRKRGEGKRKAAKDQARNSDDAMDSGQLPQ